jgi:hypothetical protein
MASFDSSTSTFTPTPSTPSLPMIHISIPVSIKLDRTNFLTWRSQIEPIMDGYGLTKHLDSSIAAGPHQISIDGQLISNPEFHTWHMQDHF